MERGQCILVLGVSGVGKTAACEDFVRRHSDWLHLRASALLSAAKGEAPETLRTSSESVISDNQLLLGHALAEARRGREGQHVLIDGHAVIDNDRQLVSVSVEAIAAMRPDGIILLEIPVADLMKRRANPRRARPSRTIDELARETALERKTVLGYGEALGLPIVQGRPDHRFRLDRLIDELVAAERHP